MTEVTRRERLRAATEREIRQHARTLLAEQGSDAVTLRAIARELGITAPALYRYYASREDLLRQLCDDICENLTQVLRRAGEQGGGAFLDSIFAVCRAFRRWALRHPKEFALVFATPQDRSRKDRFAGVFLRIIGPLLAEGESSTDTDRFAPPEMAEHQQALAAAVEEAGIDIPVSSLHPAAAYFLLRWWVRLYGHVALEVFDRFPFDLPYAERLFETMLHELASDTGLS